MRSKPSLSGTRQPKSQNEFSPDNPHPHAQIVGQLTNDAQWVQPCCFVFVGLSSRTLRFVYPGVGSIRLAQGIARLSLFGYIIQMNKVTLEQLATMSMAQLVTLSGASQFEIQNWMARLPLTTRYTKTTQGKARGFNRDNAVEICLLARLVRAGVSPAVAAERVRLLFEQWERGGVLGWVLFICDEKSALQVVCIDEPPNAKVIDALDEAACVYVLLNAARLVDRVDHFDENRTDDGPRARLANKDE